MSLNNYNIDYIENKNGSGDLLLQQTKIDENVNINTVINFKDETIRYNNFENFKQLDESDIYTFRGIMENLNKEILAKFDEQKKNKIMSKIMDKISSMKFTRDIYLPASAGSFVTPHQNKFIGYFFIFSTMLVPYQMIDLEISSKPEYKQLLENSFFSSEKNNKFVYHLKSAIRYALLLPGLIFTPFILLTAVLALRNMS